MCVRIVVLPPDGIFFKKLQPLVIGQLLPAVQQRNARPGTTEDRQQLRHFTIRLVLGTVPAVFIVVGGKPGF